MQYKRKNGRYRPYPPFAVCDGAMMRNILPVKAPRINCYITYGVLFSILPDELNTWVYNSFIQLINARGWKIYTFENHGHILSECPGIDFSVIPEFIVHKCFSVSVMDTIREFIDEKEYICIYVDRYYISADKANYMKHHFPHELLIYGYDLIANQVYIADNLRDGQFIFTACPIEDIENGFMNLEATYGFMKMMRTLKIKKITEYPINTDQIKEGLLSFINSRPSYHLNNDQKMIFGLEIFDFLYEENLFFFHIDIRALHLIYEQLKIMKERIGFLSKHKLLMNNILLDDLLAEAFRLRNLAIKFNIKKSGTLFNDVQNRIINLKGKMQDTYGILHDSII
jgi:hypothetical protein